MERLKESYEHHCETFRKRAKRHWIGKREVSLYRKLEGSECSQAKKVDFQGTWSYCHQSEFCCNAWVQELLVETPNLNDIEWQKWNQRNGSLWRLVKHRRFAAMMGSQVMRLSPARMQIWEWRQ